MYCFFNQIIFCIIFLLVANLLHAQSQGILSYKLTLDDKLTHAPRIQKYKMYFIKNKSIEFIIPRVVEDTGEYIKINEHEAYRTFLVRTSNKRNHFVLKDLGHNQLTCGKNIEFTYYLIGDTLFNFKWNITTERQQILKYNCIKATTKFRGRDYEAWFTEDIPIPYGPWKFGGLPGLIIKVNDIENVYTFELFEADFETKFDSNIISIPEAYKNDEIITHTQFINIHAKKVRDLEAISRASHHTDANGSGFTIHKTAPLIEKF